MMKLHQPRSDRHLLLIAILAVCALASILVARNLSFQPAGVDFLPFWAGGKAALTNPSRLYDFAYITTLQDIDLAPGALRPYVNPPSALLLFAPLSHAPFWLSYAGFMLLSLAVMLLSAVRARAPWWFLLLPAVAFTVYCGQLGLLLGGLILLALTRPDRPLAAGLLFAIVGTIKPQFLVLLPIALAAAGRWRTFIATGTAAIAICGLSILAFGLQPWFDWLAALPRFNALILGDRSLLETSIAPYAVLAARGWNGAWAYLLAPLAIWGVWATFRQGRPWPDQLIALVGGALMISPYAMTYELALLAPAVAAYLGRTADRRWMLYAAATLIYATDVVFGVASLAAVLALPYLGAERSKWTISD